MSTVLNHEGLDGYNLYEKVSYMRMNEAGNVELSPDIAQLVRQYFHN